MRISHFYEYKLHGVYSLSIVFHRFDIFPASVHDIHFLKDIKQQLSDCTLLGNKGYLSLKYQLNLFQSVNIRLFINYIEDILVNKSSLS
jgi:hypothetical protein